MYEILEKTLKGAYKPYDVVTDKNGNVGFIQDEPKYIRTNEGSVIRERGCKEIRVTIPSDELFDKVIEAFTKLKDLKEEDLV